jgi:hypothetical protein
MAYPTSSTPTPAGPAGGGVPPSVRTATLLIYGLIGLYVLQTILSIAGKDSLIDAYAEEQGIDTNSDFGRAVAEEGAPAYVAIAIGSLIIFGGLLVLCAVFINRRANWARIVVTILAALNILGMLLAFVQPSPWWYKLASILAGLVSIAIIVFLYRSDANAFFRKQQAASAH